MKNKKQNLNNFFEITQIDLEKKIATTISDKKILSILDSGKRLRPLLAHLSFKVCTEGKETPSEYQKALEGAVVIELAHTASLVHDDIIDKDKERRGKPALYVKEGVPNALLLGHKMLATGFDIALNHGKQVAKLYVESWNDVVNGEIEEIDFNSSDIKDLKENPVNSEIFDKYSKIIDMKTAALFSSACKAGAIEANMSGDILKVFAEYGREIGIAYQLADDLVDLIKGEMLDSVILPLLNKLENKKITGAIKTDIIKEKISKNLPKIEEFYIQEIKKHIFTAEQLSKSEIIPNSYYKDLLIDTPNYIINKMLKEVKITI